MVHLAKTPCIYLVRLIFGSCIPDGKVLVTSHNNFASQEFMELILPSFLYSRLLMFRIQLKRLALYGLPLGTASQGGAPLRNFLVAQELSAFFSIVYLPSVRASWMLSNEKQRQELMTSINKLIDKGIEFPNFFLRLENNPPESLWQKPIKRLNWRIWKDIALGYSKELKVDFLYYQDTPQGPPYLPEAMKTDYGIMYQGVPFREGFFGGEAMKILHIPDSFELLRIFPGEMLRNQRDKAIFSKHLKSPYLKLITSLTDVPFLMSKNIRRDLNFRKIAPGNAIDPQVQGFVTDVKEKFMMFYARMSINKGILEIPQIWSRIFRSRNDIKLVLIGRFQDKRTELEFWRRCKQYNIRGGIEVLGFIQSKLEVLKYLSRASVVLYPTHEDGLPFTLLEAIAVHTHVISYDLSTIVDNFEKSHYIHLVPEFDTKSMATAAIRVLEEINSQKLANGGTEYPVEYSWKKVAEAEAKAIDSVI